MSPTVLAAAQPGQVTLAVGAKGKAWTRHTRDKRITRKQRENRDGGEKMFERREEGVYIVQKAAISR
ncbi:uncharacterized protein BDCG_16387 [Blastomyces dermatitidis ER-3]|uniref:Uncharacterized protein n=1 Tax=Ajellomyces dermatitidis (strain ER-3 / ATCC MYA-2586) TaxID=559297 RepID=A0ABX2VRT8_AJEDR|nr:uncharacterized protein BDCG_16387 [Blastomyces dermatitidis ER-3]OAS99937.1 hypothetical protein BDCG_16387 [Blastomyces dermatitidis ER-3]